MINQKLEEKLEDVDIISDFDKTMIKEESPYIQIINSLKCTENNFFGSTKKVITAYLKYNHTKDLSFFYSIFRGCPREIIEDTSNKLKQNEEWEKLIEKINPSRVGIVSRNNHDIISKYLEKIKGNGFPDIEIIAANKPETEEGFYTGNVELVVDNKNLIDFIKKKDYICGSNEKRILDNLDLYFKKAGEGLYICSRKQFWSLNGKTKNLTGR